MSTAELRWNKHLAELDQLTEKAAKLRLLATKLDPVSENVVKLAEEVSRLALACADRFRAAEAPPIAYGAAATAALQHLTAIDRDIARTELAPKLALYIVNFLRERNGAELDPQFKNMTVANFELLIEQLALILKHKGKPSNWER